MIFVKQVVTGALIGGWVLVALCADVVAQTEKSAAPGEAREDWQQRVLRHRRANQSTSGPQAKASHRTVKWSPQRRLPATAISVDAQEDHREAPSERVKLTSGHSESYLLPPDDAYDSLEVETPGVIIDDPSYGGCGDCGDCMISEDYMTGDGCGAGRECVIGGGCGGWHGGYGGCGFGGCWPGPPNWSRNLSLFVGAQGFKGPFDRGSNGNFGFHQGVNAGFPVTRLPGIGFQAGMLSAYSNFSGDQVDGVRTGERDQIFMTSGVFHRSTGGGFQGGAVFDLLRDRYYRVADLSQIRMELGYVSASGCREFGFLASAGTHSDQITTTFNGTLNLQPTDTYAFYYRRYFDNGGDGRFWIGFTGEGDGLIGGDLQIPLGGSWAVQNRLNYLIPDQDRGLTGLREESWGLTIQLVWYPGRSARAAQDSRYGPLFKVADNSSFMFDAF